MCVCLGGRMLQHGGEVETRQIRESIRSVWTADRDERKEEEQKREECVFHHVHLVLHSSGDILREIHTVSSHDSHTMRSSWVNPSTPRQKKKY